MTYIVPEIALATRGDIVGILDLQEQRHPLCLGQHVAYHGQPLLLVRVEQRGGRLPLEHQGQLPGQVDHVLDARVHTLSAGRAVDVGRVPAEQQAANLEARHHPAVDAEPGAPTHVPEPRRDLRALVVDRLQLLSAGAVSLLGRLSGLLAIRRKRRLPMGNRPRKPCGGEDVQIGLREFAIDVQVAQGVLLVAVFPSNGRSRVARTMLCAPRR